MERGGLRRAANRTGHVDVAVALAFEDFAHRLFRETRRAQAFAKQ